MLVYILHVVFFCSMYCSFGISVWGESFQFFINVLSGPNSEVEIENVN